MNACTPAAVMLDETLEGLHLILQILQTQVLIEHFETLLQFILQFIKVIEGLLFHSFKFCQHLLSRNQIIV